MSRYGAPAGILAGLGIENGRSVTRVTVPSVTTKHVIVVRMHFGSATRTLHREFDCMRSIVANYRSTWLSAPEFAAVRRRPCTKKPQFLLGGQVKWI
jgi:hypothetical protein